MGQNQQTQREKIYNAIEYRSQQIIIDLSRAETNEEIEKKWLEQYFFFGRVDFFIPGEEFLIVLQDVEQEIEVNRNHKNGCHYVKPEQRNVKVGKGKTDLAVRNQELHITCGAHNYQHVYLKKKKRDQKTSVHAG